jgi:hypothetical protein
MNSRVSSHKIKKNFYEFQPVVFNKLHRIRPLFELFDKPNTPCYVYVYDDGTTRTEQQFNYDHCACTTVWAQRFLLFDRPVRTGDVNKSQVVLSPVRSAPGRSKAGTCVTLIHTYHDVPLPCRAAKSLDCVFPI